MESQEMKTMKSATKSKAVSISSRVKITLAFIATLTTTGQRQVYRDTEAKGLLLRVNGDGSKAWYYDYRDPAGGRQSFKVGDVDRLDPGEARKRLKTFGEDPAADLRAKKAEDAQAAVEAEKAESRTLRNFVEGRYWTDHLKHARSGLATQKRILSAWAPLMFTDMAALDVQDAVEHRAERMDEEVSPQTLNRDRIALLAMLNQACAWRLIAKNPVDDAAFKPLKTEDDKRVRYLGMRDEQEDIRDTAGKKMGERQRFMDALAHADTPAYMRRISILAMNTGLRRGELFKLQWSKVSISTADLTVSAATAKTNKTRHLALNTVALGVLQELVAIRDEEQRQAKADGKALKLNPYVFVNADTDKPFTTLKKSWAVLTARAQISDMTFHDLRHDFASRLVQAGVDIYEVKDLLGHSSITLTERYAHLAPHKKRAAVALLELGLA